VFYFIYWKKRLDGDGFEPDLPEDSDFLLIADNKSQSHCWAVFQCNLKDDTGLERVSDLLMSPAWSLWADEEVLSVNSAI